MSDPEYPSILCPNSAKSTSVSSSCLRKFICNIRLLASAAKAQHTHALAYGNGEITLLLCSSAEITWTVYKNDDVRVYSAIHGSKTANIIKKTTLLRVSK